jgi:gliding motility-associated-like protein
MKRATNNFWFKLIAIFISIFLVSELQAQPGCPNISTNADFNLPCTQPCTTLTANYFDAGATSSYGVSQIPYTPFSFTGGTAVFINQDDIWSGVVQLPFTFCFFGQPYTQLVIGANGLVTFDLSMANQYCQWNTAASGQLPTTAMYTNSIMGPYHDIDPSLPSTGKSVNYQIIGTAPCRIFVVSWFNIRLYGTSCSTQPAQVQQIALYETTNVIENYIGRRTTCTGWNSGFATQGIQNAAGTQAAVVPGRNNSTWNASNEGWRYTPNGPSIVEVDWLLNGAPVGTGTSLPICPTTYGLYTARATYTPCAGGVPVTVTDDVFVGTLELEVNIDSVKNVCPGAANGNAYASFNTTSTVLSYGWTPGPQNTTTLGNSPPGQYIFSVSIAGCTRSDTAIITTLPALNVNVNDTSFSTCNPPGNIGVLEAVASGGDTSAPYIYAWSNAQTGAFATALGPGVYTVTATDFSGCTASDNATVNVQITNIGFNPPAITPPSCNGGSDGSIIVSVSDATPPLTFVWGNTSSVSDTATNLGLGTYTVTATDANGCSATASYNVTQPTALQLGTPAISQATCSAGGSITASVSGGTPGYTYSWSNGQTGATITNQPADDYDVTITDANSCSITATYTIPAAPNVVTFDNALVTDITCFGLNNGSITVSVSGGSGGINIAWSNNQTGNTISALGPGVYSVTATDVNGCSASSSYLISQPAPVTFGAATIEDVTCNSAGEVDVIATGGTGTITYEWSNNQTGVPLVNVPAGTYTVTATDANTCTATASYPVGTAAGAIVIGNPVITNVSCNGLNDGAIDVPLSGGTGPLTISWSNAETTAAIANLTAGLYSITVTDTTGCIATASYTVNEPVLLIIGAPQIQNIGCDGGNTGTITANVIGGTPAYQYDWSEAGSGQTYTGQTISNLSIGDYTLTVTDLNTCSATAQYIITAVTPLVFTVSATDVTCFNGSNGTATVSVTSGTPPYSYNWNNTGITTNATQTGFSAGQVTVVVTDANCSGTASVSIAQPTAVVVTLDNQVNVSCSGGSDGSVSVTATGGTPGYTYLWSNGQQTPTAIGLNAGIITITVTDAANCTANESYTIIQPQAVTVSVVSNNALCFQEPSGSANATANGGTAPYTYLWSNNQAGATATNLLAGNYTCVATDANGCTASALAIINEPGDLTLTATSLPIKCQGDSNGQITALPGGGSPPYAISAVASSTGVTYAAVNSVINGLAAGDYTVLVTDANGCTESVIVTVADATPDNFLVTTDSTSCYGPDYNDGSVFIIATSIQNGPYQFGIDGGPLGYSGNFYNVSAGIHTITAVNFNGCVSQILALVLEPLPIIVDVIPDTLVLPLGGSGSVQTVYLNANNVTYNWQPSTGLSCSDCPNPTVTAYQTTDYTVAVSMINGTATCYGYANLHVEVQPQMPVFIPNTFTPNGDGNNDLFLIYGQDIKTVDLKIFNRWGELVFESNNQFIGWDGTYKGVLQNPAVFTYYATITFLNDKKAERKGSVTLLR